MEMTFSEFIASITSIDDKFLESVQTAESEFAPASPPVTIVMSDLARTTLRCLGGLTAQKRADLFGIIDKGLGEGNDSTKNAIATGFLETLLNQVSTSELEASEVYSLLQPMAKEYCLEWNRFCGISSPELERD
jgi:hypothetical protein